MHWATLAGGEDARARATATALHQGQSSDRDAWVRQKIAKMLNVGALTWRGSCAEARRLGDVDADVMAVPPADRALTPHS